MDKEARRTRHQALFNYVVTATASSWGEGFVNALRNAAQNISQSQREMLLRRSPDYIANTIRVRSQ